jgi:hypothetical protein
LGAAGCRGCCTSLLYVRPGSGEREPADDAVHGVQDEPSAGACHAISLYGFHVRGPHEPDPAEREAELRRAVESMNPPRFYTLSPDGSLIERDGL